VTRQAALGALLALLLMAGSGPAPLGSPESYLAYRIRLDRGEAHYRLDAGLSALAEKRAGSLVRSRTGTWVRSRAPGARFSGGLGSRAPPPSAGSTGRGAARRATGR
jgi:hypothetical protein